MKSEASIVGIGATSFFKRGRSYPATLMELVGDAILAAVEDAGLEIGDVDGFAYFAGGFDTGYLMETLGIPEVTFSASITGAGGGSAGCIGLAASAIFSGEAKTIVCVGANQQAGNRFGKITSGADPTPESAFYQHAGLIGPGHMFAMLAKRHMHDYGTSRDHFADVAIALRKNATSNPEALMRTPLTRDEYFNARMLAEPHCLYDFCLESDGAVAAVVTSTDRAEELPQVPVKIRGAVHGGSGDWARAIYWMNMPGESFASSGHASIARELYRRSGLLPQDIDVAQIYDHFTSQVIMQLEDYGFCEKGDGGAYVSSGAIGIDGDIPVNTDGGQLSCAYVWGMTHVREAVRQLRGTAANQVTNAQTALVTGGPSNVPLSGLILERAS